MRSRLALPAAVTLIVLSIATQAAQPPLPADVTAEEGATYMLARADRLRPGPSRRAEVA